MTLNDRIAKILEDSALTASEFAEEIDVQPSSISHVISGRNKPSLEFVTKIKARFSDLSWDWIINGEGEMKPEKVEEKSVSHEETDTEKKAVSLPDLFSLIDDDQFGITESEDRIQKPAYRESTVPNNSANQKAKNDSQDLENKDLNNNLKQADSEVVTLKRIVMFYSNGKFESFDQ